jgi:hypothetical protein
VCGVWCVVCVCVCVCGVCACVCAVCVCARVELTLHPNDLQMFIDYVSGELGSVGDQVHAAKIARVVVAGNIIEEVERDAEEVCRSLHSSV